MATFFAGRTCPLHFEMAAQSGSGVPPLMPLDQQNGQTPGVREIARVIDSRLVLLSTLITQLSTALQCTIARRGYLPQGMFVIASVAFRNFKALRSTRISLAPCNLLIGPNGSGKTTLLDSLLRLRTLSRLPVSTDDSAPRAEGPEVEFTFNPPHDGVLARMSCTSDSRCDTLRIEPPNASGWPSLQTDLAAIRGYAFQHEMMALPSRSDQGAELRRDGGNIAAVMARLREQAPDAFSALTEEMLRILPEFRSLELTLHADGQVEFALRLDEDGVVPAADLSEGMLYLLGILVLAFDPNPPRVLCLEDIDRGIHPRTLREVRDLLYRMSYPKSLGSGRPPVQIVTTTHSPYMIDLYREHPEEIIISHKHGRSAEFTRLSDRADLHELMQEGSLGDMWYSGILGGVPEERL